MNPQSAGKAKLAAFIFGILFVLTLIFALWAFSGKQDYKNKSDAKSAAAVAAAKKTLTAEIKQQYDDAAKSPYKTFVGSSTYGTVTFQYPKTWSGYSSTNSSQPINAYFYPDIIPGLDSGATFPVRVEVINTDYSQAIQELSSDITQGSVRATAYIPPKMKGVTNVQPGTRFDGLIGHSNNSDTNGSMVVIKVRDKTLKIYTESNNYLADFNNIILASLTFVP